MCVTELLIKVDKFVSSIYMYSLLLHLFFAINQKSPKLLIFLEKIANNEVDPKSIYDMKEKLGSG